MSSVFRQQSLFYQLEFHMDDSDSTDPHDGLRTAAAAAAAVPFSLQECRALWNALLSGQCQVAAEFCEKRGNFLVLRWTASQLPRRFSARAHDILERTLLGQEQKVVSSELGVSCSTVTSTLKHILDSLGFCCLPSKVPLLLVMLANAARGHGSFENGCSARFVHAGRVYQVLCAPIPERRLPTILSRAESDVIRMRLEGRSHAEIAASRRTSRRTVANQLATASQRLGISGRLELMKLVIHPESVGRQSARRRSRRPPASKFPPSPKHSILP
jgi:DNA-binding NarL/FixJ family response regulator